MAQSGLPHLHPAPPAPAAPVGPPSGPSPDPSVDAAVASGSDDGATVVALNRSAVLFEALADEIQGQAVGWSASALARLEEQLLARYGAELGGSHPVRRLVRLAARPRRC